MAPAGSTGAATVASPADPAGASPADSPVAGTGAAPSGSPVTGTVAAPAGSPVAGIGAASSRSEVAATGAALVGSAATESVPAYAQICDVSTAAAPASLLPSDNMDALPVSVSENLLSSVSALLLPAAPVASSSAVAAMDLPTSVAAQSLEERFSILRSIAEECVEEDELLPLLQANPNPVCYDGFEPSGRMHIAQGVVKAININKMISTGCKVKILIADWFAMLNKKLGGDLDAIRTVGCYMVEVWKALGVNMDSVEFLWSSEEIFKRPNEYWPLVMDIAQKRSVNRIVRCCQIMGRSERDELTAAQFLYPLMQCADVFFLKVDICQLGMDQRKVNMLAREYADLAGKSKPIILSHHMLPGLKEGQEKMSKSDPSSAIFMEDDEAQINAKIKKAFCPIYVIEGNPCLEYIKYIVLPWFGSFEVARKEANGGNKIYGDMDEVLHDYVCGALHPADLKPSLAKALNKILQPVRDHFNSNSEAKALIETVKNLLNSTN